MTLPWRQRTMLSNQIEQLPADLEPKPNKSKDTIIVRKLEETAKKGSIIDTNQPGLAVTKPL